MAKTDSEYQPEDWTTDDPSGSEACDDLATGNWFSPPYNGLNIRIRRRHPLLRLFRSRFLYRFSYILLVLGTFQFFRLHRDYANALSAKFSPTLFTNIPQQKEYLLASRWWQQGLGDHDGMRQTVLENQEQWKTLGSGYEGDTFAFNDTVIKVFKPNSSPLRNCVPETLPHLEWPSEIPASLILGGLADSWESTPTIPDDYNFVPILDYFLSTPEDKQNSRWHLITPFLTSGTLESLAKRLRRHEPPLTTEDIDASFRPSFNRILEALDTMHSQNNLCHDDLKMDNIFVMDYTSPPMRKPGNTNSSADIREKDTHWLLADLGNAREPSHAYHSSLLWSHDNDQHADCRINDLTRFLKSYLLFLRAASASSSSQIEDFNQAFLTSSAPWSQLYWYTMNSAQGPLNGPTAARHIHSISATIFSAVGAEGNPAVSPPTTAGLQTNEILTSDEIQRLAQPNIQPAWFHHSWLRIDDHSRKAWSVSRELRSGMRLSEKWAKIFGTMGIFKTPSQHC